MKFYLLNKTFDVLFKVKFLNLEFSKIFQVPVKRSLSPGAGTPRRLRNAGIAHNLIEYLFLNDVVVIFEMVKSFQLYW